MLQKLAQGGLRIILPRAAIRCGPRAVSIARQSVFMPTLRSVTSIRKTLGWLALSLPSGPDFLNTMSPSGPDLDIPQRRLDRGRLRLARLLDCGCRGANAVIADGSSRCSLRSQCGASPFGDEVVGRFRIWRFLGDQGRKVVRCMVPLAAAPACAMIWSGFCEPPVVMMSFLSPRAAAGPLKISVSRRPRSHDDGHGIGALQLGKLRAHVLGALVHGLEETRP